MSRRHAKRLLPTPERLEAVRGFAWLGHYLEKRPWLWVAHRRSVARGVALGVAAGVIPLPMQMALAAVLAIALRANVAAAIAATWLTNPLTFVPILTMAWWIGALVSGDGGSPRMPEMAPLEWTMPGTWIDTLWDWLEMLGRPVLIGLGPTALLLGAAAWAITMIAWRLAVTHAWRTRRQR